MRNLAILLCALTLGCNGSNTDDTSNTDTGNGDDTGNGGDDTGNDDTGSDDTGEATPTYDIGGTLEGSDGAKVTVKLDATEVELTADGAFTVATGLADESTYEVTVEPTGLQQCSVENGSGTISGADVSDIVVSCEYLAFFPAQDVAGSGIGDGNVEPWVSDGTVAGTKKIAEINPDTAVGSTPTNFVTWKGALYFSANDGTNGQELWTWNGVDAPMMVADINTDSSFAEGGSHPLGMIGFDDHLYFTAGTPGAFAQLWRWDGTNAPETALTLNSSGSSDISLGAVFDGKLWFRGSDDGTNWELWSFDGTDATEHILDGGTPHSRPGGLVEFDGKLWFAADGEEGRELWSTDGTATPTMFADINTTGNGSPRNLSVWDGKLVFIADNGSEIEVHSTDGTAAPSILVNLREDVSVGLSGNVKHLTPFDDKLVMSGFEGVGYSELYIWDGTNDPVAVKIRQNESQSSEPTPLQGGGKFSQVGDLLLFSANPLFTGSGWELHTTDGTALGTSMVTQICPDGCSGTWPGTFDFE